MTSQVRYLRDAEKSEYLKTLDLALASLSKSLYIQKTELQQPFIDFNPEKLILLPDVSIIFKSLGELVQVAKEHYALFDWIENNADPEKNMGYFDEIGVWTGSGLPWTFDFVELERLKIESSKIMAEMPTYDFLQQEMQKEIRSDRSDPTDLRVRVIGLYRDSMKRKFIEHLSSSEMVSWNGNSTFTLAPKKISPLGLESLWQINMIVYSKGDSIMNLYSLIVSQDNKMEYVSQKGVSPHLLSRMNGFAVQNVSWYILNELDKEFPGLNPVHISRGILGPYETKYFTGNNVFGSIAIVKEILAEDESASVLRFQRQFCYSEGQDVVKGQLRQKTRQVDFRDQYLVCQPQYSGRISQSLAGSNVKIIEM